MDIKKLWRNILRILLAFFGLNVFTACYGPAPYSPHISIWGKVVNEEDKPVCGIKISEADDEDSSCGTTSEDGFFEYSTFYYGEEVPQEMTLKFSDIDGPDNGGEFEDKVVTVNLVEQARESEPMVVKLSLKK